MASILSKKQKKKGKYTLKELKSLGRDLLSSRAHINNLPLLLSFVSPDSPPQFVVESLLSLQSFFTPLLSQLPSSSSSSSSSSKRRLNDGDPSEKSGDDDPEVIYRAWLRSKFDEFVKLLFDVLVSEQSEDVLREIVLDTLMEFVKLGNRGKFHSAIYHRLLQAIVHSSVSIDIYSEIFTSKYFKYIDVRYFTYISMEKWVKTLQATIVSGDETMSGDKGSHLKERMEVTVRKIYHVLSRIPPLEKHAEDSHHEMWSSSSGDTVQKKPSDKNHKTEERDNNVLSPATIAKRMKLKFTKAWISFLRLPLPLDVYKEVLANLHNTVIPHLSNPAMLCDFLTKSYDIGGVVSVMALSSLFILMTSHKIEYPNFYEKLYTLLVPSVFVAKHRAKFFQLLDTCLKSPMLPAYLAASFTKKLSRLSLSVPPSGSLVITALIYNLLRRHPSINCLVHREITENSKEGNSEADEHDKKTREENTNKKPGIDHFNYMEDDPKKSGALKSSLWEIDTLRHHYCPPVSRFVSSLETDLTVRAKTTEMNIEDFSSGSYATIFGDEIRRRVKQVPLAFYKAVPTSLFAESDFPGWTFGHSHGSRNSCLDSADAKRQRVEETVV
ncbi:PREDICTED: nucleolar complex protein 4 homolog [Tarenaya hassleriana]|uniref:nucleolar complex protein 4 homolog n=1 Tax=Tarenaya hassleriana TaxID=28532 RepID=UPI00053CA2F7|nr:PREDICTED: nucleolar complex protein 4 homolog [Tarenaya hassleriana]